MAKEMMNFNLPKEEGSIIKVIGVGGGGSNAVNHMYKQGIRGVDFVVCNTDQQALDMSPVPKKIALGSSLTEGRGAGAQAEVGRNAAIENLDDIKEILGANTKMVFITAGMGGGTGTGAAPVIAQAAREQGILTVGIVTIPFGFEGKKRKLQADLGLEELKKHVDTVLIISNDKLREMYGNLKLSEAFGQADDVLTIAAKGIAEIITVEGYVNVDFEDVRTVMTGSGVAIMGSATTSGPDRAIKAVELALASPLLNDNNIYGASNILLYISSGREEVTMDEVAEITDYIQEEAGMDADVIWGNGTDLELEDKLTLTVIATGFSGEKLEKVTGKENVIRHVLDPRQAKTEERSSIPSGLTARPVLLNTPKAETVAAANETTFAQPQAEMTVTTSDEPVIKYSLTEDVAPTTMPLMAFKVEENDLELNALLDAEAPEMIGIKEGEEFPLYNEDDEDDEDGGQFEVAAETDSNLLVVSEFESINLNEEVEEKEEEKQTLMPFSLFKDRSTVQAPEMLFELDEEEDDNVDDHIITTEKATEIEFELNTKLPTAEVNTFNLYNEAQSVSNLSETDMEPKLVIKTSSVDSNFDADDMQRRQNERMERLKNMNQRFRSPSNLAELENVPAFKRRNVNLSDTPHSSESSVTRFDVRDTEETDENGRKKGGLSNGNEYLHKTVD